jgi:hypothetical protein
MSFGVLASHFGARERYWPVGPLLGRMRKLLAIDTACLIGGAMMLLGFGGAVAALSSWAGGGFSAMQPETLMRVSIPSVLLAGTGLQLALTSFLLELLSHPARGSER